jgi:acyl-CoA synthetase (NDP forming)
MHASARNPVDLVGSVEPQLFAQCLELLLASDEVDSAVILYVPRLPEASLDIARAVCRVHTAAKRTKTVLTVFTEGEQAIARLQQELKGIHCFQDPESAARALALVTQHAGRQSVSELPWVSIDEVAAAQARAMVDRFLAERGAAGAWLAPAEVYPLLSGFHLPVAACQLAGSNETALQAARRIGFPVVMKAVAPSLLHKSAAGGVVLDIRNAGEASDAWHALAARISGLTGVVLQPYLPGDVEAIIGAKWEPGFGHVIGLGTGGTRTERLQQVEFRLLPLASRDAYDLIRDSAFADVCLTVSGQFTATGVAMFEALLRLSALISAVPEIDELDLNPVSLLPPPRWLCVLDARVHVGKPCSGKQNP